MRAGRWMAEQQPDDAAAAIVPGPFVNALRALPLSGGVSAMLSAATAPLELPAAGPGLLARSQRLELRALLALGVMQPETPELRPAGGWAAPRELVGAASRSPGASQVQIDLLTHRLRREWIEIQGATPHEVVGVPLDVAAAQLHRACARAVNRFANISSDPSLPDALRELADRIQESVGKAVVALMSSPPKAAPDGRCESAEEALRNGQEALLEGKPALAASWFAWSRRLDPQLTRVLAWHGWAIFHDDCRPVPQRERQGLELVRLAARLDVRDVDALYMMGRLELRCGNAYLARDALRRVLRLQPDHAGASPMLDKAQDAIELMVLEDQGRTQARGARG